MPIPETQLETWSHQGSITQSSNTYNSIRNVLLAKGTPYVSKNVECFLQGSYGNDTNIWAESDVDVVIELQDCFNSDLDALNSDAKTAYDKHYPNATYTHVEFKRDVLKVLSDQYGSEVKVGKKAVQIAPNGSRRKADVIVATAFRRYHTYVSAASQRYTEGISFYTSGNIRIDNYPKQHRENLVAKHKSTNSWFKPMVRVLKNMRSKLVADGMLTSGTAPSYYIEGLLYNVPDEKFGKSYGDTFVNSFNWIRNEADKTDFECANKMYFLLRDNTNTCWPKADGDKFISEVISLWNNWK
jgi:hypothetical protein